MGLEIFLGLAINGVCTAIGVWAGMMLGRCRQAHETMEDTIRANRLAQQHANEVLRVEMMKLTAQHRKEG